MPTVVKFETGRKLFDLFLQFLEKQKFKAGSRDEIPRYFSQKKH
jgi:hypothetical protein